MVLKSDARLRTSRETIVLAVCVSLVTAAALVLLDTVRDVPKLNNAAFRELVGVAEPRAETPPTAAGQKRLIFYTRPPKTGSTTVRIAMKRALEKVGLVAAHCFNMIEWNELTIRTIINRRNVDFYGCHTRLTKERYRDLAAMRGGNITFLTSTREPSGIILSSYLQWHRDRNIAGIKDKAKMEKELAQYKEYVVKYPVGSLYGFHGADVRLTKCPYEFPHEAAMRRAAERYEIVIDVAKPKESAALVEIVTGLKPDFDIHFNVRNEAKSSPMLKMLADVDTSSKSCGNALVHKVLTQQFNAIKDRLLQNRCFDERNGTYELCEKVVLDVSSLVERTRAEVFKERKKLIQK